jgi:hypothetical protein
MMAMLLIYQDGYDNFFRRPAHAMGVSQFSALAVNLSVLFFASRLMSLRRASIVPPAGDAVQFVFKLSGDFLPATRAHPGFFRKIPPATDSLHDLACDAPGGVRGEIAFRAEAGDASP